MPSQSTDYLSEIAGEGDRVVDYFRDMLRPAVSTPVSKPIPLAPVAPAAAQVPAASTILAPLAPSDLVSDGAVELIVDEEVTGKGYYVNHYARPTWPEGASGVTIGIGYDVGYVTADKLWADWRGKIPNAMIQALETAVGVHGEAAHEICGQIRNAVVVPWDVAMEVFLLRDIPEWTKKCEHDLPNFDKLSLDCKGAIVSIAYNRGNSWNMPASEDTHGRFTEMRAIKAHMIAGNYRAIPDDIRSMKRLWNNGLVARREHEAVMFEKGLATVGA